MEITSEDVLIVVDVQNDFCPGGALAVPDGDAVIEVIHRIAPRFEHIVLTQDWHPPGHHSFACVHGKQPFETTELHYGEQTLWPDHCVQGTWGADFHPALRLTQAELILRKGFHQGIDSYSAFFENDHKTPTGLAGYLRERELTRVFFAGLAYDFCVGYSALDAHNLGLGAIVIHDGCRAIDLDGSVAMMEASFSEAGLVVIQSHSLDI
jgi:nicotinamidase/pyrazinamidase